MKIMAMLWQPGQWLYTKGKKLLNILMPRRRISQYEAARQECALYRPAVERLNDLIQRFDGFIDAHPNLKEIFQNHLKEDGDSVVRCVVNPEIWEESENSITMSARLQIRQVALERELRSRINFVLRHSALHNAFKNTLKQMENPPQLLLEMRV